MGAPKQKWTADEEAALKAGVLKHGAGKWRTILKDPEFSSVLYLRSNVDLKDKWRNMSVMANGWGPREKSRITVKRPPVPNPEESFMTLSAAGQTDEETIDAKPHSLPCDAMVMEGPKRSIMRLVCHPPSPKECKSRLEKLIMEAITSLKEPGGSNKTTIATYIEDQYWAPPNFKRVLSAKLKHLTSSGKLIKVKRRYRIAPPAFRDRRIASSSVLPNGWQRLPPRVDRNDIGVLTMPQVDLELAEMKGMTAEEAAVVAARAVAEAEAAIAAAEEAAREAEAAEADAEAAQAFAEATMKTTKGRNIPKMMIRT